MPRDRAWTSSQVPVPLQLPVQQVQQASELGLGKTVVGKGERKMDGCLVVETKAVV
jgi:hypothetical protein